LEKCHLKIKSSAGKEYYECNYEVPHYVVGLQDSLFSDEYFDFIYIDGNHSYDAVKDDLTKWYPKLKKGGLIAGDDYSKLAEEKLFNYNFGVKRAVDEFATRTATKKSMF
jgi:predicted O-methyltransferase YrrM